LKHELAGFSSREIEIEDGEERERKDADIMGGRAKGVWSRWKQGPRW